MPENLSFQKVKFSVTIYSLKYGQKTKNYRKQLQICKENRKNINL